MSLVVAAWFERSRGDGRWMYQERACILCHEDGRMISTINVVTKDFLAPTVLQSSNS